MKPRSDWSVALSAWVLWLVLQIVARTWRIRITAGREILDRLLAEKRPVLLTFWHNRSVFMTWFLYRYLVRKGFPMMLLASRSRDGEIVSRVARKLGVESVRGSSSKGGSSAFRSLHRKTKEGFSPVAAPDGPRRPIYECKPGTIVLARTTGAPIQPFSFATPNPWRLGSWDRMIVPRPFARVDVALGEPLTVPRKLAEGELPSLQAEVERRLAATHAAVDTEGPAQAR